MYNMQNLDLDNFLGPMDDSPSLNETMEHILTILFNAEVKIY